MITGLLLAAGASKRYPGHKLLQKHPLNPEKRVVIETIVQEFLQAKIDDIIVVTGYNSEKIQGALENFKDRIRFVHNPEYHLEMSTSVIVGIKNLPRQTEIIVITPADLAFLTTEIVNKVLDAHINNNALITVPKFKGRRGHPIIFSKLLIQDLLNVHKEKEGMRSLLRRFNSKVLEVEVDSPVIFLDVDRPEDWDKNILIIENS